MEGKEHSAAVDVRAHGEAELLALADRWLAPNYAPARMVLRSGSGCVLHDTEGRRYLDFLAGVAVCSLGHAHPALRDAIAAQAAEVVHVSNYFFNEQNVLLAEELCRATGFDRAFFCNSGTEANEAGLKLARRHFYAAGAPRNRVIAFHKAFHGRTLGALALTGNAAYLEGFGEPLAGIEHVDFGDLDAVASKMGDDVAAVWVEPVQGEGGVHVPPPDFFRGLRRLCDQHGALLVVDEVQTGMGRTGKMLAHHHFDVQADVVLLAKGLGGGVPIGALLFREAQANGLPRGAHGSTFGGNPLASVAARTVLRVLREEGLVEAAHELGAYLGACLQQVSDAHPQRCRGERGLGLMRALGLVAGLEPRAVLPVLREHGLLAAAGGADAIRLLPPLVVTRPEIDEAMDMLSRGIAAVPLPES